MLPEQEEILRKATCLDLCKLKTEILASPYIPEELKKDPENLLTEYRRFLVLKVIFGDSSPPLSLSPSAILDQVWHLHLLTPVHYINCCKLLGEEVLDHDPSGSRDRVELIQKRLEMTKKSYKIAFGEDPPQKFWTTKYHLSSRDVSENSKVKNEALDDSDDVKEEPMDDSDDVPLSQSKKPKKVDSDRESDIPLSKRNGNSKKRKADDVDDGVKKISKNKLEGGKTRKRSNENSFGNKICDNEKAFGKDRQKSNDEKKESLNPEKNGTDTIDIRVRDTGGKLIQCKMRRSTKMKKLFDRLYQMGYGNTERFDLIFSTLRVGPHDTIESLQMENKDVLEMYQEQAGC